MIFTSHIYIGNSKREEHRKADYENDKASFTCDVPLVVHFDGKTLKNHKSKDVEVLPILVTGADIDKLIDVCELGRGTGKNIAEEVSDSLFNWDLIENIIGGCFDTTSVNTGVNNGAMKLLEAYLNRPLLSLACHHHFRELELKAATISCLGKTSGPEMALFN